MHIGNIIILTILTTIKCNDTLNHIVIKILKQDAMWMQCDKIVESFIHITF